MTNWATNRVMAIGFTVSLMTGTMCSAQTFIQYQPAQLDFTPYRENQQRQFEMMQRAQEDQVRQERSRASEIEHKITQAKSYYASFFHYPTVIPNGWHNVTCVEETTAQFFSTSVLVKDNKITTINNPNLYMASHAPIANGKAMTRLTYSDRPYFVTMYFFDYIEANQ